MNAWRIVSVGMVFVSSGCASASELQQYYKPINETNYREAATKIIREKKLESISLQVNQLMTDRGLTPSDVNELGDKQPKTKFIASGLLVQAGPDKPVVFVGSDCVAGSSCGCSTHVDLQFAKDANGSVVILAPTPEKNEHIVRRIGPCTYGCGMPTPEIASSYELPVTNIDNVSTVPVPFEVHVVYERCLISSPAP